MKTLKQLQSKWEDKEAFHKNVHEIFCALVDGDDKLKAHRDYVQNNVWGFGERSFWWLWKLLLSELPATPDLLEIGCFRGATLSVWKLLKPYAKVFGITPLDTSGNMWDSDYAADIAKIHEDFNLPHPFIFHGRSDNRELIKDATSSMYDLVYIDGDHSYDGALHDLVTFAPCVKKGGFLVIDDACCDMVQPFGYFQGIKEVTDATLYYMTENGWRWEFIGNTVHLRVYKRK